MKLFTLLLLYACACYAEPEAKLNKKRIRNLADICRVASAATNADVADIFQQLPASGTAAKCLRACIIKTLNLVDADNRLNRVAVVEVIKYLAKGSTKELLADRVVDACIDKKLSKDACEAAEENVACAFKQFKDRDFKPEIY